MLGQLVQLYIAIWVVVLLHEIGHMPEKIKFSKSLIPSASAMRSYSRYGGLIVNAVIFISVFYFKPEIVFLQLVGLVAWVHFILYTILGSIVPEQDPKKVNMKTYVFDDVPNELWYIFITIGLVSLYYFKEYYSLVFGGVFL